MAFLSSSSSTGALANTQKDIEVTDPPSDSISSLAFSSAADFLAVGSWNNEVRYERTLSFVNAKITDNNWWCAGSFVRGRRTRTDARAGGLYTPRSRTGALLEQSALLFFFYVPYISA